MGWWFFRKKNEKTFENMEENKLCICGKNKNYLDCHALEFELPLGERPEPDY